MATWKDLPFEVKSVIIKSYVQNALHLNRRHDNYMTLSNARYGLSRQLVGFAAAVPELRHEFVKMIEEQEPELINLKMQIFELTLLVDKTQFEQLLLQEDLKETTWKKTLEDQINEMLKCRLIIPNAEVLKQVYDVAIAANTAPGLDVQKDEQSWGAGNVQTSSNIQTSWDDEPQLSWEEESAKLKVRIQDWNQWRSVPMYRSKRADNEEIEQPLMDR